MLTFFMTLLEYNFQHCCLTWNGPLEGDFKLLSMEGKQASTSKIFEYSSRGKLDVKASIKGTENGGFLSKFWASKWKASLSSSGNEMDALDEIADQGMVFLQKSSKILQGHLS